MTPGHPPSIVGDGAESADPSGRCPQDADPLSCLRASLPSRGVGHLGGSTRLALFGSKRYNRCTFRGDGWHDCNVGDDRAR